MKKGISILIALLLFISLISSSILADCNACTPNACPEGYTEVSCSCSNKVCTRTCQARLCANTVTNTWTDTNTGSMPHWNEGEGTYEEYGDGREIGNHNVDNTHCYMMEYHTSDEDDYSSDCIDLETGDDCDDDDHDEDCDGDDLDAYAGAAFSTNSGVSWLSTVTAPSCDDCGWTGVVTNSYWSEIYLSDYDNDMATDSDGDWNDLDDICDITHSIWCAPDLAACNAWEKDRCGYGCADYTTRPYFVVGIYNSDDNEVTDAFNDDEGPNPNSMVEDNDYDKDGQWTKLTEYSTTLDTDTNQCTYECDANTDCDFCQKCEDYQCAYQSESEDLKNECNKQMCYTGNCNGNGGCNIYNDNSEGECLACQYCGDNDAECDNMPNNQQDNTGNNICTDNCYEGVCCTADCSCAADTCVGSLCSNNCGGFCEGTKEPDCSYAADTCIGDTCSNGCWGICEGTLDCCANVTCDDQCDGNIRLFNGQCSGGECLYETEECENGCLDGLCIYFGDEIKIKKVTYQYDDFGNINKTSYLGNAFDSGDEKYVYTKYLYNTDEWLINKPKHTFIKDHNGNKVSETWISYDNLSYGEIPSKGELTYQEYWLDNDVNPGEEYEYDSYGNLIKHINSKGYETNYIFDSTHTFLIKEINPKEHEISYEYDKGTGNLISETDPNENEIEYVYDVFGRKIKEVLSYDSMDYPTTKISYSITGSAPSKVKVKNREEYGMENTLDSYYYYDGFGRLIQGKRESEGSELITRDIHYNEKGGVEKESNPYYITFSESYTTPNQQVEMTIYTYDILNRLIRVINTDGTNNTVEYHQRSTISYDENNHRKDYEKDAYGNIVMVKEYNNEGIYTTTYDYNVVGDLIQIKDSQNNTINYTYDSLGRKIELHDPDLGTWSYEYDIIGNLIKQTDNKGTTINLEYDKLDRMTKKTVGGETINYTYDQDTIGTLTNISSSTEIIHYNYDDRIRIVQEERKIDDLTFIIIYQYDAMDRVTSKTLPDNTIIEYTYNDQGKVETINGILNNIDYNEVDGTVKRQYSNNLATDMTYNPLNYRLERITTPNKQDLNYEYDYVGNVIQISNTKDNVNRTFMYDDIDRLIFSDSDGEDVYSYNVSYDYDSIGNLLKVVFPDENFTFFYSYDAPVHAPTQVLLQNNLTLPELETFNISLKPGFNLVSVPFIEVVDIDYYGNLIFNDSFIPLTQPIENNLDTVFYYKDENWYSYSPDKPLFLNSLHTFDESMGVWFKMDSADTLTIAGLFKYPVQFNMSNGWNMIGYPSAEAAEPQEVFGDVYGTYKTIFAYNASSDEWQSYNPDKPEFLNSLHLMIPGHGYWVYATQDSIWEFDGTGFSTG